MTLVGSLSHQIAVSGLGAFQYLNTLRDIFLEQILTRASIKDICIYGGGIVDVSPTFALKPSVLVRYMETNPMLVDFNLRIDI